MTLIRRHRFKLLGNTCALYLLLSLFCQYSYAQNKEADSLKNYLEINEIEDTSRVQVLARLSYLQNSTDPKKGVLFGEQALKLARKLNDDAGKARAFNSIGVNHYALGENGKAIESYEQAIHFKQKINDLEGAADTRVNIGVVKWRLSKYTEALHDYDQAYAYFSKYALHKQSAAVLNNMGIIFRELSDYTRALDTYQLSLVFSQQIGNYSGIATTYNNIGGIHSLMNNWKEALYYRREALKISQKQNNRVMQAMLYGNMGSTFRSVAFLDSAEYYYQLSLKMNEEIGSKRAIAGSLMNLGLLETNRKQYDKAMDYYQSSLALRKETGNKKGQARALIGIAGIHQERGRNYEAMQLFREALGIGEEIGTNGVIRDAHEALATLYEEASNYRSALYHFKEYVATKNLLFNEDKIKDIARLEAQYHADKETQEMLLEKVNAESRLERQVSQERSKKNLLILGLIVVCLLAALFFWFFRMSRRAKNLLEEQNQVISDQNEDIRLKAEKLELINSQLQTLAEFKAGLVSMIAHDMKTPLNAIIGLSSENPSGKHVQNITQAGYQLLNMISNMLDVEKFEESELVPKTESVPLDELIYKAKDQVDILLQAKGIQFQCFIPKNICLLIDEDLMIRVMVNLLTNAIKYSETGGIIRVCKTPSKKAGFITISVRDQGEGIEDARLKRIFDKFWSAESRKSGAAVSTGLGLSFCKLAIEAHDGEVWAESEIGKGTVIHFDIPLDTKHSCEKALAQPDEVRIQSELIQAAERIILAGYLQPLLRLKVHQVSAITKIIQELDEKQVKSRWKSDLEAAVFQGDQRRFEELVEMLI